VSPICGLQAEVGALVIDGGPGSAGEWWILGDGDGRRNDGCRCNRYIS
jgi:hypothetical protein